MDCAFSAIVPVYNDGDSLPRLLEELSKIALEISALEVVFVIDGSPDGSADFLRRSLPDCPFASQLLLLSRNFGSFAAIRAGMSMARGKRMGVLAADLQDPPNLLAEFNRTMQSGNLDVVFGQRISRDDGFWGNLLARLYWGLARRFIQKQIPKGGADVFGCTAQVRDQVMALTESNTTLIGLLLWTGFDRGLVPYARAKRQFGKSSWSVRRKIRYALDFLFAFSKLPLQSCWVLGALSVFSSIFAWGVLRPSPILVAILLLGGLNLFGLGVVGEYVWRGFENSKGRPGFIIGKSFSWPSRG